MRVLALYLEPDNKRIFVLRMLPVQAAVGRQGMSCPAGI